MDTELLSYALFSGLSVFGIATNSLKYNPIRFQCNNYVLNTYLYFILTWSIVLSSIKLLEKYNIQPKSLFIGGYAILFILAMIFVLIAVLMISPKYFFTKHLLYLIFASIIGVTLYPVYTKNTKLFKHVGYTTLTIFIVLSLITFIFPSLINEDSWGKYLMIGLVGLIIARIVEFIIVYKNPEKFNREINRKLSYFAIVLFIFFIMYDTKIVTINAKMCKNDNVDYINESLNIFIDSLNLFTNLLNVSSD